MLPVTEKGRLGGCDAESGMESLPVTDSPHRKWWLMVPGRTFWPHPCVCPCPVLAEMEEGRTKSHSLKFKSDVSQVPPGGGGGGITVISRRLAASCFSATGLLCPGLFEIHLLNSCKPQLLPGPFRQWGENQLSPTLAAAACAPATPTKLYLMWT